MEFFKWFIDFVLHLDTHLSAIMQQYGYWTYFILFLIIFAETGLVIAPFLPGDSLIFAAGAFAGTRLLNIAVLFFVLAFAAILGDTLNYFAGKFLGSEAFSKCPRIFKEEYMKKTHSFYEKYGNKTIVLARFVPIVRTFAPFVAGVGKMKYKKFLFYNVLGGLLWVSLFAFGGYFFGNIPVVKNNFSIVIMLIILLSIIPIFVEIWKQRRK